MGWKKLIIAFIRKYIILSWEDEEKTGIFSKWRIIYSISIQRNVCIRQFSNFLLHRYIFLPGRAGDNRHVMQNCLFTMSWDEVIACGCCHPFSQENINNGNNNFANSSKQSLENPKVFQKCCYYLFWDSNSLESKSDTGAWYYLVCSLLALFWEGEFPFQKFDNNDRKGNSTSKFAKNKSKICFDEIQLLKYNKFALFLEIFLIRWEFKRRGWVSKYEKSLPISDLIELTFPFFGSDNDTVRGVGLHWDLSRPTSAETESFFQKLDIWYISSQTFKRTY